MFLGEDINELLCPIPPLGNNPSRGVTFGGKSKYWTGDLYSEESFVLSLCAKENTAADSNPTNPICEMRTKIFFFKISFFAKVSH